jgi:hypothetical protein
LEGLQAAAARPELLLQLPYWDVIFATPTRRLTASPSVGDCL